MPSITKEQFDSIGLENGLTQQSCNRLWREGLRGSKPPEYNEDTISLISDNARLYAAMGYNQYAAEKEAAAAGEAVDQAVGGQVIEDRDSSSRDLLVRTVREALPPTVSDKAVNMYTTIIAEEWDQMVEENGLDKAVNVLRDSTRFIYATAPSAFSGNANDLSRGEMTHSVAVLLASQALGVHPLVAAEVLKDKRLNF